MVGLAIAPSAVMREALISAKLGVTPAIIGALGAGSSLYVLPAVLAPVSMPMSILGITLGLRSHNIGAVILSALAGFSAIAALWSSEAFWLVFVMFGGTIGTV